MGLYVVEADIKVMIEIDMKEKDIDIQEIMVNMEEIVT